MPKVSRCMEQLDNAPLLFFCARLQYQGDWVIAEENNAKCTESTATDITLTLRAHERQVSPTYAHVWIWTADKKCTGHTYMTWYVSYKHGTKVFCRRKRKTRWSLSYQLEQRWQNYLSIIKLADNNNSRHQRKILSLPLMRRHNSRSRKSVQRRGIGGQRYEFKDTQNKTFDCSINGHVEEREISDKY